MNKVLMVMCMALLVLTGMSYAQESVSNTEARRDIGSRRTCYSRQ